jgi:hypothetical protein
MTSNSWFALTPDQDEVICAWKDDFSTTSDRLTRISVTRFSNDDGTTSDKKIANWVQLKLFKLTKPPKLGPDGKALPELGIRKSQQIGLRPIEAEKILKACEHIRLNILSAMYVKHSPLAETFAPSASPTDLEDSKYCHWFLDLYQTLRRKIRISYTVYNVNDPLLSFYVQVKVFTRKEADKPFIRQSQVNINLREFRLLADKSEDYVNSLRECIYGENPIL